MIKKRTDIIQQFSGWSREQLIQEHDSLREVEKILKERRPQDTEIISHYVTRASHIGYVLTHRASEQVRKMAGWEIVSYNASEEAVKNITSHAQAQGYRVTAVKSPTKIGRFDVYVKK